MESKENSGIQPGIYDITIEDYHNGAGISRSSLTEFKKSAKHYWHKAINPEREPVKMAKIVRRINALDFGNALHTYILEPDEFEQRYLVMPKVALNTKVGAKLHEEYKAEANGRQLVCEEAYADIKAMGDSCRQDKWAQNLIDGAEYEKSIFWEDVDTGLLCKVRPDIWHDNFIADVKTADNASLKSFKSSVFEYGYHIQAAMIQEALKRTWGKLVEDFVFIVIEKKPPYAVGCYRLDPLVLAHGLREYQDIIQGIRRCHDENEWPSYLPGLVDLPHWARRI